MKTLIYTLLAGPLLLACGSGPGKKGPTPGANPETLPASIPTSSGQENPIHLFMLSDAEKIMGEGMYLSDSSSSPESEAWVYQSVYSAKAQNGKRDVYYMYEQYRDSLTCKQVYAAIKKANEKNGIEVIEGMADEAYFHSDGDNFCFLLVRKGDRMVRLKVNKISEKTSKETFLAVGKRIISS